MADESIFRQAFQNVSNAVDRGLSDIKQIEMEAEVFLKQWKKNYAAYLRDAKSSKRRRKNFMSETLNEKVADLSEMMAPNKQASTRPTRNARNIAIDNIRKHSMMPLGKKLRRPDSGDEVDCYSIANSKRVKSLVDKKPEPVNDILFVKPKEATRKRTIRKLNNKSQISETETNENKISNKSPARETEQENIADHQKSPEIRPDTIFGRDSELLNKTVEKSNNKNVVSIEKTPEEPENKVMEEPVEEMVLNQRKESKKTESMDMEIGEKIVDVVADKNGRDVVLDKKSLNVELVKSPQLTPQRATRSGQNLRASSAGLSYVSLSPVEPSVNDSVASVKFSDVIEINGNKSLMVTSIRETINESLISEKSIEIRSSKKRKGKSSVINESDIFESSTSSRTRSGKKQRSSKKSKQIMSSTLVDFLPNAESSSLDLALDKTHNITAGNKTFLVNDIPVVDNIESESRADIFAHIAKTVVKGKKNISKEEKRNSYQVAETSDEEPLFRVPEILPVPQPVASKRTKPVKASKFYDAEGNLLNDNFNASKRTKVLAAPTVVGILPDVSDLATEGRPVRVRTKVRRFGMSDEINPQPPTEEATTKVAKAVSRKSKARRPSLKINQNLLTKLQASHKKLNTPLATVTNNLSAKKPPNIYLSASKENPLKLKKKADHNIKVIKQVDDDGNRLDNLKNKQQKEELASLKKIEEINRKKEILKQKNDEKLEKAKKMRQKQEDEKLEQIMQAEKEKELKRKMILQEREKRQREELHKKKLIAVQKHANHEERRRLEEEARMEKIKEMELEEQRQLEEKQRRLEYEEKRAKERIEEKKRMMEAEKMQKQKMAEARAEMERKQNAKNYCGQYLPKNDDDLGLEDERSEESGDDDDDASTPAKNIPPWARDKSENLIARYVTKEQMAVFMPLRSKTPDVHRMFNMSPARKLRRTSSAIWETTMMTPS